MVRLILGYPLRRRGWLWTLAMLLAVGPVFARPCARLAERAGPERLTETQPVSNHGSPSSAAALPCGGYMIPHAHTATVTIPGTRAVPLAEDAVAPTTLFATALFRPPRQA